MAFWDKILRKKKEKAAAAARGGEHAPAAEAPKPQPEKPHAPSIHPADAFFAPILTEKASGLNERGAYFFRVHRGVTKPAFARAVSRRYGVAVAAVRMLVMPGKTRVRGRITGWKPGFKKAIVTLKKGEKIEIQ